MADESFRAIFLFWRFKDSSTLTYWGLYCGKVGKERNEKKRIVIVI